MSFDDFVTSLSKDQKQKLLDALSSDLGNEEEDNKPSATLVDKTQELKTNRGVEVNEDFTVNRNVNNSSRRTPVKAKKNTWSDNREDYDMPEDEFPKNRKRSSRNRSKTQRVQLECSVCGKTFMEHPSLVYGEYHRCNKCVGR